MTPCARAVLCRFICVLLCFSGVTKAIRIEKFDVPQSVVDGESPRLTCYHTLDPEEPEKALVVKWWWMPVEDTESRTLIYQRLAGHEPQVLKEGIEVEEDDRLKLVSVDPQDSGTYECEASIIEEDRRSSRLIVYTDDIQPVLNATLLQDTNGETEAVLVECWANDVAPQPELIISVNEWPYNNDSQVLSPAKEGRYAVMASVTVPFSNFTGDVRCDMNFTLREVRQHNYFTIVSTDDLIQAESSTNVVESDNQTSERAILRLDIPEHNSEADLRPGELNPFGVSTLTTVRTQRLVLVPKAAKRGFSALDISGPKMAPRGAKRPISRLDLFKPVVASPGGKGHIPTELPDISVEMMGPVPQVMRPVAKDVSVEMVEPPTAKRTSDSSMEIVDPPALKRQFSTLDISEEIVAAEALKPAVLSNAAIYLKNTAVFTTLVTVLTFILL